MTAHDDAQAAIDNAQAALDADDADKAQKLADAQQAIADLTAQDVADKASLTTLQSLFDAYKKAHPDTTPPPPTTPAPLIGMAAEDVNWAQRKSEVEATGGKLQARRVFLTRITGSLGLAKAAITEGLYPVISTKPGAYSWAQIGSGAADADLKTLAASLKALGKPVFLAIHHEPASQSGGVHGEGGTAADFAAMNFHACDVIKAAAPNVAFGVIMNGWFWSSNSQGLSDADLEVWLPKALRAKLDVLAADDYSPAGGEPSAVKIKNRVAWAKRVGSVKATGVGEFGGFVPSDLADVVNYAKTEPLFRGGFLCVWNSTGTTYLPLSTIGLLDDFQALLKAW